MLPVLFEQLREAMVRLAELGWAHGDLSPYNVLLDGEGDEARLVIIDWPQIVDVIGNPHGPEFLERDTRNMASGSPGVGMRSTRACSSVTSWRRRRRGGSGRRRVAAPRQWAALPSGHG